VTIYENIVIGKFLFTLGARMGQQAPTLPITGVNLMQQCPLDERFGDVLLGSASICLILEFKRKKSRSKKEIKKRDAIAAEISDQEDPAYVEALSRKLHWYVEIDDVRKGDVAFETRVAPYLDLARPDRHFDLLGFVEQTATQALRPYLPAEDRENFLNYLDFIAQVNDTVIAASGKKKRSSSSAFLLTAAPNGQIKWFVANELRYLFMTPRELALALNINLGPEIKQGVGRKPDIGHKIEPGNAWEM
jgi:hypothetical protein